MLTLNDGRSELWQWDTGRKLTVDTECSQVHFSNNVFGRSIDMPVIDGVVEIPDFLLQTDKDLNVWAFVGTPENGYTKISKSFKVNRRNKPADYVFTPTDQTTLGELLERLEKIEETQDPDAIKNAVDDYLASNPIQIEEKDPTVPDWAKKPTKPSYTAKEVGALPSDTVIPVVPEALPNPQPLTFTGAVEATYDGSKPVEVVIPQGGGGSGGAAKTQKLLDLTFTEATASVSVTLEHNFHKLFLVWKGGEEVRTVNAEGAANSSNKLAILLNSTSFAWNSRKVGVIDDDGKSWRTSSLFMEWSEDLSTYYGPLITHIATSTQTNAYFNSGGETALSGTVGADNIAPASGTSVNIVLQTGFFAPNTRIVLVGEYYE